MSINNVSNRSTTATSSLAPSQSQTPESSAAAANQATATPAAADGLESKPVYPNLSTEASAFKLSPEGEKRHRPHWISLTTAWKPSSTGGTVPEQWHSPRAPAGQRPLPTR